MSYGDTALASPSAVVYVAPLTHGNLATKVSATVAGQTSVKVPEKATSTRCPHCLLALAPQTYCFPGWPAIGLSLVTTLS